MYTDTREQTQITSRVYTTDEAEDLCENVGTLLQQGDRRVS